MSSNEGISKDHLYEKLKLPEILNRVAAVIGSDKDVDIAEALGAGRSTLSTWRAREYIPYENIFLFCLRREISAESILTGDNSFTQYKLYNSAEDALLQVLDAQRALDLVLTADQIKVLLEFAYKTQASTEHIRSFIAAAFKIAGLDLPKNASTE